MAPLRKEGTETAIKYCSSLCHSKFVPVDMGWSDSVAGATQYMYIVCTDYNTVFFLRLLLLLMCGLWLFYLHDLWGHCRLVIRREFWISHRNAKWRDQWIKTFYWVRIIYKWHIFVKIWHLTMLWSIHNWYLITILSNYFQHTSILQWHNMQLKIQHIFLSLGMREKAVMA